MTGKSSNDPNYLDVPRPAWDAAHRVARYWRGPAESAAPVERSNVHRVLAAIRGPAAAVPNRGVADEPQSDAASARAQSGTDRLHAVLRSVHRRRLLSAEDRIYSEEPLGALGT